eukprot:CAMPEP_0201737472 /NCGR_PEP_ID=MMETSP0593-20130828/42465_1 /ASSEMBLY_ACC=CAM_ASM_000672 /TAXON_ID=267983 /ORGANISM="Skeletonema japonicum, Strain CCMP2506" /LENGTH=153 /DNA_ID=CAMNT_0048231453 /DNA_START=74 /DNA_END=535 /DNA_ORIENTATION=-
MMSSATRLLSLLIVPLVTVSATVDRPNFKATARVKQHYHRTGQLVDGEEHLLKAIIRWDPMIGAEEYQLCHNCNHISEETGAEKNGDDLDGGEIIEVDADSFCGGQACHVMPGCPQGLNKFHLRVKVDGEWSAWSNYQNFNVKEPGNFDHEEL